MPPDPSHEAPDFSREFALGIEALGRFVRKEPLRRTLRSRPRTCPPRSFSVTSKGIKACAKGIVGQMKTMQFHLKSVFDDGDDLFDGDDADDPSRLEGNVDDQTDDVGDEKALAAELDKLIYEVRELAARCAGTCRSRPW